MIPYLQHKERSSLGFVYEYWWVTKPEIFGYRLMLVRIPPLTGACSDWDVVFWPLEPMGKNYDAGDERKMKEDNEWSWVKFISEPREQ